MGTPGVAILQGNALEVLKTINPDTFQSCITSPPYFNLRAYKVPPQIWDATPGCDHNWEDFTRKGVTGGSGEKSSKRNSRKGNSNFQIVPDTEQAYCLKCRAWLGHLGLEPSIEEYVTHLVQIFREVKRVLKPDGLLFLNIADSYNSAQGGGGDKGIGTKPGREERGRSAAPVSYLPEKSLLLVPARVALALGRDGWILRSEIVWGKPNAMPESVEDRPTKGHEMVYMLAKSPRYTYHQDAMRERLSESTLEDGRLHRRTHHTWGQYAGGNAGCGSHPDGRNSRTVWSINTTPSKIRHFATMPQELVEKCLLASTIPGDHVLDPFYGSGTTGIVSTRMGRSITGIELSEDYVKIAKKRPYQYPFFFEPGRLLGD